jgi:uncharacterized protein YukE
VYVWAPSNDDGGDDYLHLTPITPRQAFQPMIDSFRGLRRLAVPEHGHVNTEQDASPQRWQTGSDAHFQADFRIWEAMCRLADVYVECGWDVSAVVQTTFRSAEFIEKRAKYVSEVVEPLEAKAYEEGSFNRRHPELCVWVEP